MEPMENKIATVQLKNNTVCVSGAIDFDNVVPLWKEGIALINAAREEQEIKIDLKELTQSDSSGLAVLVDWLRVSQEKRKTIRFINVPSFMQDILKVCGLEGMLPVLWEN